MWQQSPKTAKLQLRRCCDESARKQGLEAVAQTLSATQFTPVQLNLEQPRTVWVALLQVHVPKLEGTRACSDSTQCCNLAAGN